MHKKGFFPLYLDELSILSRERGKKEGEREREETDRGEHGWTDGQTGMRMAGTKRKILIFQQVVTMCLVWWPRKTISTAFKAGAQQSHAVKSLALIPMA